MPKTTIIPVLAALSLTTACFSPELGSSDPSGESSGTSTSASEDSADPAGTATSDPSSEDPAGGGSTLSDSGVDSSDDGTGATTTAAAVTGESGESGESSSGTGATVIPADIYVDAEAGDDGNDGSLEAPKRTITAALAMAASGEVVAVFPGQYDAPHGELFPIEIGAGVTLIGDPESRGRGEAVTRILGNGMIDNDTSAAVELQAGAEIRGFAITSSSDLLSFGIFVAVDATIAENTFDFSYGGVRLAGGGSHTELNTFETNSYGVYGCDGGTGVVSNNHFVTPALPVDIRGGGSCDVLDNWIEGNGQVGMQNQGGANLVAGNTFDKPTGYTYGCFSGGGAPTLRDNMCGVATGIAMRLTGAQPIDLGTPADPGGNTFGMADAVGIVVLDSANVQAVGNTWASASVTCGVDVDLQGPGSVTYGVMQACG